MRMCERKCNSIHEMFPQMVNLPSIWHVELIKVHRSCYIIHSDSLSIISCWTLGELDVESPSQHFIFPCFLMRSTCATT